MADELLNSIIDVNAIKAEFEELTSLVNSAVQKVIEGNNAIQKAQESISGSTNISGSATSTQAATKAINELTAAENELIKVNNDLLVVMAKKAALESPAGQALVKAKFDLDNYNKSLKDNLKAEQDRQAQAEKSSLIDRQRAKDLTLVTETTAETLDKYQTALLGAENAQEKLSISQQEAAAEAKLIQNITEENTAAKAQAINTENQETAAIESNTIAENQNLTAKERAIESLVVVRTQLAEVSAEMALLNAQYEKGTITYAQYIQAQVKATETGIELKAEAKSLGSEIDGTGQKASQFESIVQRMGLRFIANLVIFQGAIELFKALGEEFKRESEVFTVVQDTMADIAKNTSNAFTNEAISLQIMKDRFEDVTTSMSAKQQIVEDLNLHYSNQIGVINGVNDAEQFFRDKTPDMIKALELRGQAEAALEVLRKNSAKEIELAADPSQALKGLDNLQIIAKSFGQAITTLNDENIIEKFNENYDFNKVARAGDVANQSIIKLIESSKVAKQVLEDTLKSATSLDESTGIDTSQHSKKAATIRRPRAVDTTTDELEAQKRYYKALSVFQTQNLEITIENNKKIVQNEQETVNARILANDKLNEAKNEQAKIVLDNTTISLNAELATITTIQAKEKAGIRLSGAEKKRIEEDNINAIHQELLNAQIKYQASVASNNDVANKKEEDIWKAHSKDIIRDIIAGQDEIKLSYEKSRTERLQILEDEHNSGLIGAKKYTEETRIINEQYDYEELEATKKYLNDKIATLGLEPEEQKKIQELITKILNTEQKNRQSSDKNATKDKNNELSKEQKLEVQLALSTADAIKTIFDGVYQRRVDQLNAQKDLIESTKQSEIDAVNASAQNSDEKSKEIQVINEQAKDAELKIQREVANEKRKQAILDKEVALAKIAIATAVHIIESSSPLEAILWAALGAIELAVVAATPIPAYATGTENHPGGLAELGDGGERELVKEPGKLPYWSAATSTIYNLKANTQVIPESQLAKSAMNNYIFNSAFSDGNIIRSAAYNADKIERAIIKSQQNIIIKDNSGYLSLKLGASR